MVRVSHLTENCEVLVLEFARLSLQLHSIAVPQWITEKILIRYEGNETTFAQHFHELGRRRGLVVLLHPLFYSIQHFSGELKGLPLSTHTSEIVKNSTSNS